MKTINNNFEVGEECYTYYRKNVKIDCPICKGNKKIIFEGYEYFCKNCDNNGQVETKMNIVVPAKVKVKRIIASIWEDVVAIKYKVVPDICNISIRNRQESTLFKTLEEVEEKCREINLGNLSGDF